MNGSMVKKRESSTRERLGSRLSQVREYLGYSQDKMARLLNIGKATYSKNERGLHLPVTQTVMSLHHSLGISAEWFLFGSGPMLWKDIESKKEAHPAAERFGREVTEMLSLMERIPLFRHSLMLYFQKLKMEHHALLQDSQNDSSPTPQT